MNSFDRLIVLRNNSPLSKWLSLHNTCDRSTQRMLTVKQRRRPARTDLSRVKFLNEYLEFVNNLKSLKGANT